MESLPENLETTKLMHKFFGSTKNQLKRLTRLVDDMLDISRISSGKLTLNMKRSNMTDLILNVLDRFKDQLKASEIDYQFFYQTEIYVHCDPEKIDQVITNFMTNAIRYGQKKPIHIYLEEKEDSVVIKFRDHGRGIEIHDQERIFKRFERAHTDEDVSGLGLGLYINGQIIEEHKGTIKLISAPGAGATFVVELPKLIE
jgi:signal transduction histidine kinase